MASAASLPGALDQRIHQRAQCRHRLCHTQALRGAHHQGPLRRQPSPSSSRASTPPSRRPIVAIFPPPPVHGTWLRSAASSSTSRTGATTASMPSTAPPRAWSPRPTRRPGLAGIFSSFTVNTPQLDADVDRVKAKVMGVPLQNVFETMQINLGSLYVNDFNRFGRTYQVIAQADADFRQHARGHPAPQDPQPVRRPRPARHARERPGDLRPR